MSDRQTSDKPKDDPLQTLWQQLAERARTDWEPFADAVRLWLFPYCFNKLKDALEAEEAIQRVLITVWQKMSPNSIPKTVGSFLRGIARHKCADIVRERNRQPKTGEIQGDSSTSCHSLLATANSVELEQESREVLERIKDEIGKLRDPERTAITMKHIEGHPHKEIATKLGITIGASKQAVFRGLARIKKALAPQEAGNT